MDGCFLGWLLLSIFSDFEQVKNYFADSEQVKKANSKTPVGKTRCLCIFFCMLHATDTPPCLLRPMRVSASFELYPDICLFVCFFLNA